MCISSLFSYFPNPKKVVLEFYSELFKGVFGHLLFAFWFLHFLLLSVWHTIVKTENTFCENEFLVFEFSEEKSKKS